MGIAEISGRMVADLSGQLSAEAAAQADAASVASATATNLQTRQSIRAEFEKTVGSDGINTEAEKAVDKLLFDMLSRIDFSRPGGEALAGEIKAFIASRASNMGDGDLQHLYGLLKEAATTLPAELAGGEVNDAARERINSAFEFVAKDGGGVCSSQDEIDVSQMLFGMLPLIDFSKPGGADYEKRIRDALIAGGEGFSAGEIQNLQALLNEAATALKPSAAPQPLPPPPPALKTETPSETEDTSVTEKTADTKPESTTSTTSTNSTNSTNSTTDAQKDDMLEGVLKLLLELLSAQADGTLTKAEREKVATELSKVLQKLTSESDDPNPVSEGGDVSDASDSSASSQSNAAETASSAKYDTVWFLQTSGLGDFLSSFFGDGGAGVLDQTIASLNQAKTSANAVA